MIRHGVLRQAAFCALAICAGCARYTTPGGPAPLAQLAPAGSAAQPTLSLPATFSVVRVQAADYRSASALRIAGGAFSLITEPQTPVLDAVAGWPQVERAAALPRSLLPPELGTLDDLRLAAVKDLADVLLVYTLDTRFEAGGQPIAPLDTVSPDRAPGAEPRILTRASALLLDARTGFRYGAADADAAMDALDWRSAEALERQRRDAEQRALDALLAHLLTQWRALGAHGEFSDSLPPPPDSIAS